jgi:hypothetical protein
VLTTHELVAQLEQPETPFQASCATLFEQLFAAEVAVAAKVLGGTAQIVVVDVVEIVVGIARFVVM